MRGRNGTTHRQSEPGKAFQPGAPDDPTEQSSGAAQDCGQVGRKAEEGELAAIREIADRLDGKPVQMLDRRDVPLNQLTDEELLASAAGALPEREEILLLPPAPKSKP